MNLLHLYQIGDMIIPPYNQTHLSNNIQISSAPKMFLMSDQVVFPLLSRQSNKNYSMTINVYGDHLFTRDQYLNKFNYLLKKELDLIAYLDLDECPISLEDEESEYLAGRTGLLWFTTQGAIASLSDKFEEKSGKYTLDLQLNTKTFWYPLNRLEWNYRASLYSPSLEFGTTVIEADLFNYVSAYPSFEDIAGVMRHGKKWARRNIIDDLYGLDWHLDQNLWTGVVDYLPAVLPPIGKTGTIDVGQQDLVSIDTSVFGQVTQSFYRIPLSNDMDEPYDEGTITLSVQSNKNIWDLSTSVTVIDLDDLNTKLAAYGYTGILAGDVLYFGDWTIKPGFIARGDTLLPIYATIDYATEFPAQLDGSYNKLDFTGSLISTTHSGMQLDYLHLYRRD